MEGTMAGAFDSRFAQFLGKNLFGWKDKTEVAVEVDPVSVEELEATFLKRMTAAHERMAEVRDLIERVADTDVTVLVRSSRSMNLIQVSGTLRPLDLVHLSGHFGIPRVDPNAVMVPAPDGR